MSFFTLELRSVSHHDRVPVEAHTRELFCPHQLFEVRAWIGIEKGPLTNAHQPQQAWLACFPREISFVFEKPLPAFSCKFLRFVCPFGK